MSQTVSRVLASDSHTRRILKLSTTLNLSTTPLHIFSSKCGTRKTIPSSKLHDDRVAHSYHLPWCNAIAVKQKCPCTKPIHNTHTQARTGTNPHTKIRLRSNTHTYKKKKPQPRKTFLAFLPTVFQLGALLYSQAFFKIAL